jgi:drug/metabolite transporter (DMT)-like permease
MASRDWTSAVYLTVFASLVWGTSFPGTKFGLRYVGNDVFFLWLRFIVAAAITLTVVVNFSIFKKPIIWLIGGFNAGGFMLQYIGLTMTTASKTALLVDINIVAVAIISYFAFRERLGRIQAAGIILGIAGAFLLTLNRELRFEQDQIFGDIIVYLAGWSWAFFIVLNKKVLAEHTGIEISSAAIATCALWLTIPAVYLFLTGGGDFTFKPIGLVAIVYLGLFCTSIATLLWAMGLEGVSATASATIMLVEVLTALAISIGWLGESLSTAAIVGAIMVMLAIYLVAGTGQGEKAEGKAA